MNLALTIAIVGLVSGVITVAVVGAALYFVDFLTHDRIAKALAECDIQTPAPAPASDPQGQAPATTPLITDEMRACFSTGPNGSHQYADWAKTATHWVCVRCGNEVRLIADDDLPYDQDAEQLVAETVAYLAGGAA